MAPGLRDLPNGEGVLTPRANEAYRTLLFVGGWFVAGGAVTLVALTLLGVLGPGAAKAAGNAELAAVVSRMNEMAEDIAEIRGAVGLQRSRPKPLPVRPSGVGP